VCRDGSVAHVDFGILLNVRFAKDMIETRIKLSSEFVQVMGDQFGVYKQLCIEGFLAVRRHSQRLLMLLEMVNSSLNHRKFGFFTPSVQGGDQNRVFIP